MNLLQEKTNQAIEILKEKDIDLWLTFIVETSVMRDPVMDYIFGDGGLTWPSALIFTRAGECIAIVGRYETESVERGGLYPTVLGYDKSIRPLLTSTLERIAPRSIAINTSRDSVHADGLTHGRYLNLIDLLQGTDMAGDDAVLLVVASGVASELEDLRSEVLEDGSEVDGRASSHTLGVLALLQVAGHAAHGELQAGLAAAAHGLGLLAASGALATACHCC